ncbi:MAG: hypothetical protein WBX15_00755 [Thermoanaerobaculia bacterium]
MRMSFRLRLACLVFLTLGLASAAAAREMHWKSLDVDTYLDRDGRLRTTERQTIVFTGDWNGGERIFNIRAGQKLRFVGMNRIDPVTHEVHRMTEGDLGTVDHYQFVKSNTLRWRSRNPSDPPFDGTVIEYQLMYELSNVLQNRVRDALSGKNDRYTLDLDFVFPDRNGVIESFSLVFNADPVWRTEHQLPLRVHTGAIAPGGDYVVTIPFIYVGRGTPVGVFHQNVEGRFALVAALLVGVVVLLLVFLASERRIGRLRPLEPGAAMSEQWLEQNVFRYPPEVVGAVWDESIGAPEVAAVLARMVSEEKISTRVDPASGVFSSPELHMTLLVPRASLSGYELELVDGLFVAGDETSTSTIKEHYKSTGFDPSKKISPRLTDRMREVLGPEAKIRFRTLLGIVLFLVGVLLLAFSAHSDPGARPFLIMIPLIALIVGHGVLAAHWRSRIDLGLGSLWLHLIPQGLLLAAAIWLILSPPYPFTLVAQGGFACLALMLVNWALVSASTHDATGALALRKRLAAARRFFERELNSATPRLKDAWFPYVVAFGLAKEVDRWTRAFGAAAGTAMMPILGGSASSFSSSSSSSSSGGPSVWTGGGSSFGGAGASASWAAAAGGITAGVSSPSSSSGGGGGSSGGGGGGGW